MVINKSEVQMASQVSFTTTTRVEYQTDQTPAFRLGDITFAKTNENEELAGTNPLESISANRMVRMQTLNYLLRSLLLSRLFGEDSDFNSMLNELIQSNSGYMQTTQISYVHTESQELNFSSTGTAITADGRRLEFNYGFALSDSFTEEFSAVESKFINYIDPLVINLDDSPTRLSDQVFYFDLDGDGQEEEISRLAKGSGFLALDRNGDGQINDGTELFGTKSGDGFKDLQIFDEDNNGWIDENDPIFEKLRVWTMNEDGEMELFSLKESDVGAIYLGRVNTEFIDRNDDNKVRAAMRQTGIFLHESDGHAGGVQHVDFAT